MMEMMIQGYVNTLQKDDIVRFAASKNIMLLENEVDLLYDMIKKDWKVFYHGNPTNLFLELEKKLRPQVFAQVKQLYIETKNKLS